MKKFLMVGIMLVTLPAAAASRIEATSWEENLGGAVRFILAHQGFSADGAITGGVEFSLKPGWHIYWRTPGEVGLPPVFHDSGSVNLKSYKVNWPLPHRSAESGQEAFTYDENVVLPIQLIAANAHLPVKLDLSVDFGICSDICAPSEGHFQITLKPGNKIETRHAKLIHTSQARVPVPQSRKGTFYLLHPGDRDLLAFADSIYFKQSSVLIAEYGTAYAKTLRPQQFLLGPQLVFELAPPPPGVPKLSHVILVDGDRSIEITLP